MPVFVALLVIDVVLLVDAFTGFGITDAFELRLGRYILLKIAARASALARCRLDAVDDVAVVVLARGVCAAIVHDCLLRAIERAKKGAVPRSGGLALLAAELAGDMLKPARHLAEHLAGRAIVGRIGEAPAA